MKPKYFPDLLAHYDYMKYQADHMYHADPKMYKEQTEEWPHLNAPQQTSVKGWQDKKLHTQEDKHCNTELVRREEYKRYLMESMYLDECKMHDEEMHYLEGKSASSNMKQMREMSSLGAFLSAPQHSSNYVKYDQESNTQECKKHKDIKLDNKMFNSRCTDEVTNSANATKRSGPVNKKQASKQEGNSDNLMILN